MKAIDDKRFLKLKSLDIEAGLVVKKTSSGGIDVELAGIKVGGKKSSEYVGVNTIKLTFYEEGNK